MSDFPYTKESQSFLVKKNIFNVKKVANIMIIGF